MIRMSKALMHMSNNEPKGRKVNDGMHRDNISRRYVDPIRPEKETNTSPDLLIRIRDLAV